MLFAYASGSVIPMRHLGRRTLVPLYLDNNATTPLLPAVWEAMTPYFLNVPGNPASSHQFGRGARVALEDARG